MNRKWNPFGQLVDTSNKTTDYIAGLLADKAKKLKQNGFYGRPTDGISRTTFNGFINKYELDIHKLPNGFDALVAQAADELKIFDKIRPDLYPSEYWFLGAWQQVKFQQTRDDPNGYDPSDNIRSSIVYFYIDNNFEEKKSRRVRMIGISTDWIGSFWVKSVNTLNRFIYVHCSEVDEKAEDSFQIYIDPRSGKRKSDAIMNGQSLGIARSELDESNVPVVGSRLIIRKLNILSKLLLTNPEFRRQDNDFIRTKFAHKRSLQFYMDRASEAGADHAVAEQFSSMSDVVDKLQEDRSSGNIGPDRIFTRRLETP